MFMHPFLKFFVIAGSNGFTTQQLEGIVNPPTPAPMPPLPEPPLPSPPLPEPTPQPDPPIPQPEPPYPPEQEPQMLERNFLVQ
jgi:hypothetical protein